MFSPDIYTYLSSRGISREEVDRQYNLLVNGANFSQLLKPATLNDGIYTMDLNEAQFYANFYLENNSDTKIEKFVPASGAATRMFNDLVEYESTGIPSTQVDELKEHLHKLAFHPLIPASLNREEAVKYLISTLYFNSTPKGLIPFHLYKNGGKTPFEEHWMEAILYAANNNKADLHFTISSEHLESFHKIEENSKTDFEQSQKTVLKITYSNQKQATDTICIEEDNHLVHTSEGIPLLRPGGHGALIQNLQELESDLVFIKNIDNVVHQNHLMPTILYKQALAGKLIQLKSNIFEQLIAIKNGLKKLKNLEQIGKESCITLPDSYSSWTEEVKVTFWKSKLNRPIRVCGMVKNQEEPGGGPFWVKTNKGNSLQIVESAQIDLSNKKQLSIFKQSTHFNPVDLVCYLSDFEGNKFNLLNFIDDSTAFITSKMEEGKEVKVLEHPGLWNGGMADWITIFVEVPIETFNPVKTVNDLLKSAHLS